MAVSCISGVGDQRTFVIATKVFLRVTMAISDAKSFPAQEEKLVVGGRAAE
jgi:hypothetical protein